MPEQPSSGPSLAVAELYRELTATSDITSQPVDEDWVSMIERTTTPGKIHEITEGDYCYFFHVLPPKLIGGSRFAFAEGDEPLRLFWKRRDRYFCRQLTRSETHQLCDATGLPRDYGYS